MSCSSRNPERLSWSRLPSRSRSPLWSHWLRDAVLAVASLVACLRGLWRLSLRDISISDGDS